MNPQNRPFRRQSAEFSAVESHDFEMDCLTCSVEVRFVETAATIEYQNPANTLACISHT